jgi:hypothetical protein
MAWSANNNKPSCYEQLAVPATQLNSVFSSRINSLLLISNIVTCANTGQQCFILKTNNFKFIFIKVINLVWVYFCWYGYVGLMEEKHSCNLHIGAYLNKTRIQRVFCSNLGSITDYTRWEWNTLRLLPFKYSSAEHSLPFSHIIRGYVTSAVGNTSLRQYSVRTEAFCEFSLDRLTCRRVVPANRSRPIPPTSVPIHQLGLGLYSSYFISSVYSQQLIYRNN